MDWKCTKSLWWWVAAAMGFEGKFSVSFGPTDQDMNYGFALGPSWTIFRGASLSRSGPVSHTLTHSLTGLYEKSSPNWVLQDQRPSKSLPNISRSINIHQDQSRSVKISQDQSRSFKILKDSSWPFNNLCPDPNITDSPHRNVILFLFRILQKISLKDVCCTGSFNILYDNSMYIKILQDPSISFKILQDPSRPFKIFQDPAIFSSYFKTPSIPSRFFSRSSRFVLSLKNSRFLEVFGSLDMDLSITDSLNDTLEKCNSYSRVFLRSLIWSFDKSL